ncbi:hypothetical protein ABE021_03485 [Sporosarcina gallistercoris]|uniref:hypothetical protein n=1 Tax=Sporosarcina gallistercoris TaxID=2762245 RepID=UPI003D2B0784
MKKQLFLLLTLIVILAGCSETKEKTNILSVSDVTDRERAILQMNTDHGYMFDFKVNEEFKEATVWVEKYEKGSLADHPVSSLSSSIRNKGTIIFSMQRPVSKFDKTVLDVGSETKKGAAQGKTLTNNLKALMQCQVPPVHFREKQSP